MTGHPTPCTTIAYFQSLMMMEATAVLSFILIAHAAGEDAAFLCYAESGDPNAAIPLCKSFEKHASSGQYSVECKFFPTLYYTKCDLGDDVKDGVFTAPSSGSFHNVMCAKFLDFWIPSPPCLHLVQMYGIVARWQNLIPSFPWIAPGWRVGGGAIQGKEEIKFCSAT